MSDDARQLVELFESLAPTLGRETALKLMDAIPPAAHLTALGERMDARFTALEQRMDARFTAFEQRMDDRFAIVDERFDAVDQRFTAVEHRFTAVDQRFTTVDQRMDDRLNGLRSELLAAFRGELVTAVSGQTRHVIVATAMATFGIGGLAVTLAQLLA